MAQVIRIDDLPAPPAGKEGWPWTQGTQVDEARLAEVGDWPKISVVSPSFNQGQFLEETIRSVLLQSYPNLEYFIIDGGSTDGSVEIIRKYESFLTGWVSEKDRGQSHAINKGIERCSGELFNWINSDDYFAPGALYAVAEGWRRAPGRIVAGGTISFNEQGIFSETGAGGQTLRNFVRFWDADDMVWHQQSTFVPLAPLQAMGGVREDLRYTMDYHMMVSLLRQGIEATYVEPVLAYFRFHPDSKTVSEARTFRLERVNMLRAMTDLPIEVADWEWNREQSRRFIDLALREIKVRHPGYAARFFMQAMVTAPWGGLVYLNQRLRGKVQRSLGTAS